MLNSVKQLEKLSLKHKDWIDIVQSFGCNESLSEDVVQDSYLKIYDRLEKGVDITYGENDVNTFYMYMTLRSVYINSAKRRNVWNGAIDSTQENLDSKFESLKDEYADVEMEDAYRRMMNSIFTEINSWDFYSRNIFIAYYTSGLSLTNLSEQIGIGRSSLYNSIRLCRDIIKEHFSEDVEDFYNGDYSKI